MEKEAFEAGRKERGGRGDWTRETDSDGSTKIVDQLDTPRCVGSRSGECGGELMMIVEYSSARSSPCLPLSTRTRVCEDRTVTCANEENR